MSNYQVIINGYQEPKKRLTTDETYKLIDEYQATKNEAIKDRLVNDNTKLVLSMARRFYGREDSMVTYFKLEWLG